MRGDEGMNRKEWRLTVNWLSTRSRVATEKCLHEERQKSSRSGVCLIIAMTICLQFIFSFRTRMKTRIGVIIAGSCKISALPAIIV